MNTWDISKVGKKQNYETHLLPPNAEPGTFRTTSVHQVICHLPWLLEANCQAPVLLEARFSRSLARTLHNIVTNSSRNKKWALLRHFFCCLVCITTTFINGVWFTAEFISLGLVSSLTRKLHLVIILPCVLCQWKPLTWCFFPFWAQGTPTIMCNEFGETIAIIATSEGEELPLEQALEIYHTAMENSLAVDGLQLLWGRLDFREKRSCILLSPNRWL